MANSDEILGSVTNSITVEISEPAIPFRHEPKHDTRSRSHESTKLHISFEFLHFRTPFDLRLAFRVTQK
jgi:hypothetical protein